MAALSGIRVLDLADESGAYCGKLLGEMGADVIKVEPPGGDAARRIGPFHAGVTDPDRSLFFWYYNTGKRSVVLDLEGDRGRHVFLRLLAGADVVVTTGNAESLERRGLDYATLAAHNAGLIVCAITGFGLDGPRARWKSCDTVAQALGGMLFVNGHPDEPPLRSLGLQAYHSACLYAAIGILLALIERQQSGRGQQVEVSLQECVAAAVEHVSGLFRQRGEIEVRRGTLHWTRAFRVGRCRDGYVLHGLLGDWTSLIEWVKADGKAADLSEPAWEDFEHRRRNCSHVFDILDGWAREYTVADLVDRAQLRRLPYGHVASLEAVADNPQLRARRFFACVRHEGLGVSVPYPVLLGAFSRTPAKVTRRPPLLGEHTKDLLAELRLAERASRRQGDPGGRRATVGPDSSLRLRPWNGGFQPRPLAVAAVGEESAGRTARVLEGVRVLDFTWVFAGPVATRILADHGAEVIKIERCDALDLGSRRGGITGNLNRGKRSLAVRMSDPRGLRLVRELVRHCDIVIDNFSARVMHNWGLDYRALREIKPDIIAVSMSGFGHTGPWRDRVSYGPTLQALAGYTLAMRHPGGEPAGWGFSYVDMAAGAVGALAALIALWHRRRTGEGQFVDLAQFEIAVALVGPALLEVLVNHTTSLPHGNRSPERAAAPHGVYRCRDLPGDAPAADRWCAICVFGEEEWRRFVDALGRPAWASDTRFSTLAGRLANQSALDALVEGWTSRRTAEDVMETLQAAGLAAGVVANARDLCERDPHLRARDYWRRVRTPEGDWVTLEGIPTRLSRTPGEITGPGPQLGEHTHEVLKNLLGVPTEEIDRLEKEGVLG